MATNLARVSSCLTINTASQTKDGGVDNSRAQLLPSQPDETEVLINSIYYSFHSCRVAKQPSWILRLGLVRFNFRGRSRWKCWLGTQILTSNGARNKTRIVFFFTDVSNVYQKNTDVISGILSKTTTSKKTNFIFQTGKTEVEKCEHISRSLHSFVFTLLIHRLSLLATHFI